MGILNLRFIRHNEPKGLETTQTLGQSVEDLKKVVDELQKELSTLRVNKVSSGVASKLSKIKVVRKGIARSLTYINMKNRSEIKDMYKDRKALRAYNQEHNTTWS